MTGPAPSVRVAGSAQVDGAPLFGPLEIGLAAGRWTCLLGPSGVGKSTVLRLIAGLPTGVDFDGNVTAGDGAPLDGRVAFMAQSDLLFPWLDVTGNLLLGARLRGETPDAGRAADLLAGVGLSGHAHKRPASLSGGERQRAALARTLMEDRPVVLLDEPFSSLDARTRADMQELAAGLLRGRTVLLVTHDPAEAARLGDAILVMAPDGIRSAAPPDAPPVRAVDDAATLACQGRLFAMLREAA